MIITIATIWLIAGAAIGLALFHAFLTHNNDL